VAGSKGRLPILLRLTTPNAALNRLSVKDGVMACIVIKTKKGPAKGLSKCVSGMFTGYRVQVPNERCSAYH
jgi:hypothetical protein